MKKVDLIIIDPQNDFCDIPDNECPTDPVTKQLVKPALPVPGAQEDMRRLGQFIKRAGNRLNDIYVTLDSHNPVDIGHPSWLVDSNGNNPPPFTIVSSADLKAGVWRTANPLAQTYTEAYAEALEANKRYPMIVWPEHCLIGSWGHNVNPLVKNELDAWARRRLEVVNYVTKGSNPKTEHYSAVQAEVPDPDDAGTLLNTDLINPLAASDMILVAGEALSHCLANTVRDIANNFGEENIRKIVLLTDCTSSVTGFEAEGEAFIREMVARGMQVAKSTEMFV